MFREMHHADVDSTNLEASRRVSSGAITGPDDPALLITAARQTAGRGRAGRAWSSPTGGLWLSLAWPMRRSAGCYAPLPLVAGLAVAEAVERETGLAALLKWPNDLLVDGRKLAGLLCSMEFGGPWPTAIIGVGLNANLRAEALGTGLRLPPVTLLERLGRPVDLTMMRDAVADSLAARLDQFETAGFDTAKDSIEARLAYLGEQICIERPADLSLHGRLRGLTGEGHLLIETPTGQAAISVGDVVHLSPQARPAPQRGRARDLELSR